MGSWPWPLDAVEDWFQDLWNWISSAAVNAVSAVSGWIWDAIGWLKDRIYEFTLVLDRWIHGMINELWGWIVNAIEGLKSFVSNTAAWITNQVHNFVLTLDRWIHGIADELWGWIVNAIEGLKSFVSSSASWIRDGVLDGITAAKNSVSTGVTGLYTFMSENIGMAIKVIDESVSAAVGEINMGISGAIAPVVGPLIGVLSTFSNLFEFVDPVGLANQITVIVSGFSFSPDPLTGPASGAAQDVYLKNVGAWAEKMNNDVYTWATIGALLEAGSMGQVDNVVPQFMNTPKISAFLAAAKEIWTMEFQAKMGIQTNQAFMAKYTPMVPAIMDAQRMLWRKGITMTDFRDVVGRWGYGGSFEAGYVKLTEEIPGPGDLIRFVVREVIKPEVFTTYMGFQGFSAAISEWFWEAHWILPGRGEIVDAFHRGLLSIEERDIYMVLHDFKPEPRPGIKISDLDIVAGIAKTLIPRVDLRYGWEMGQISDTDLEDRYRGLGYEDDAPLMADIQRSRALTEEIHKVRDEWIRDYLEGYIGAETLRANLATIGIGAVRIDYYVTYAVMRREREHKKDLLAYYVDAYLKDMILEEAFEDRVYEILDDLDAASLFIEKAYVRKFKTPKPPRDVEAEKAEKELYKYRVSYARELYRVYAIEKPELSTMWIEAGMDPSVAATRADFEELKRPIKKPLPEIIEAAKTQLRIQKIEETTLIEEYRREVRTAEELLTGLTELKYSEALATAITQLEIIRKYKKPAPPPPVVLKTASLAYVARLFREGEISEAAFRIWLSDRFYSLDAIDTIVRVETLKIEAVAVD